MENQKPESPHREFVHKLYRLGRKLHSSDRHAVAQARRQRARLRRSLSDERFVGDVYEILLPCGVPRAHEPSCLLLAGLFALHPDGETDPKRRWRLCAALAETGSPSAADARVRQLIGSNENGALEHYLRQSVRLIATAPVARPLDYERLLWDLIRLRGGDEEKARTVRLDWARDFRRQMYVSQPPSTKEAT
ncbi:type I-E CRISPR-associated protein Cse2/CasB [Nocardiopsis halophila]|uniref:type I-E CRISPR-associated protein Cse2/CasB n=1 Tax=Nocardiopsis halophila TaxID=141692 RepID=UPI000367ABD1|nr:type I-E CRISPR-associated protein Cse2/CasB [Nocardiopsis halophila]